MFINMPVWIDLNFDMCVIMSLVEGCLALRQYVAYKFSSNQRSKFL